LSLQLPYVIENAFSRVFYIQNSSNVDRLRSKYTYTSGHSHPLTAYSSVLDGLIPKSQDSISFIIFPIIPKERFGSEP